MGTRGCLEFLDALLRGCKGKLPVHVSGKLRQLLKDALVDPSVATGQLDKSLRLAQLLVARSVFLDELLVLARAAGADQALLQLAVSNLPVTHEGLARMLADDVQQPGDAAGAARALVTLEDLSLLHRLADGAATLHRWTAQGLDFAEADLPAYRDRCVRAGRYRWWRVENQTHDIEDAIEAARNFLACEAFDKAVEVAIACFGALRRFQTKHRHRLICLRGAQVSAGIA